MKAHQLWFTGPQQVEIREQQLPPLQPGRIRVKTHCSAISAGTEMLVYREQLPADITLDATLASLQHPQTYPLQYGYACVGRIEQIGAAVDGLWQDRLVFAFQPHASHFIATPEQVIALPDDIERGWHSRASRPRIAFGCTASLRSRIGNANRHPETRFTITGTAIGDARRRCRPDLRS